tara:strand:+ start:2054 stop:3157 length:1104 start_codon:yes stop_codon:yes gene_type:complete
MKILVDENIPFAEETFGQHAEIIRYPGRQLTPDMLANCEALITRSITRVNSTLFSEHQPDFVGSCTIGIDHLDVDYLQRAGITWTAAPGCNAQSVVDYVLSALAVINSGQVPKVVGIVGCGNVGGLLRARLLEIGCKLKVYDPFLGRDEIVELSDSLEEVMQSDLVCIHAPLTAESESEFPTVGMIDRAALDKLSENAILLNAGRGGVIKEADLRAFMAERSDVRVVLDVWENEPRVCRELMSEVALATPHIAGYSMEGKARGTSQIYREFCRHFGFEPVAVELLPRIAQKLGPGAVDELLLEIYNPQADTYRMRNAESLASEDERRSGLWFDELRKNYPERREIASYKLEGQFAPELIKYGFTAGD